MKKILLMLTTAVGLFAQNPSVITLTASAPSGVPITFVRNSGIPQQTFYCYWVVTVYPGGMVATQNPGCTSSSSNTLNGSNFNVVSWSPASGNVVGYWVIRGTSNFPASGTTAVNSSILSATTLTLNDQSNSLNSFTFTGMGPATANIRLDNTNYVQPRLISDTMQNLILGNFSIQAATGFTLLGPATAANKNNVVVVADGTSTSDCTTGGGSNNALCLSTGTVWTPLGGSGGGGGASSVFTGSTATTPAFSATPTFSLSDISTKSPVRVQPGAMTANVTAVTFTNTTAGAKFSIVWLQDGTGGRTVTYGGSTANTCVVSPVAGVATTQFLEVAADGTTVNGTGCSSNETPSIIRGTERAAPATPPATTGACWFDSTAHTWQCLDNNSSTKSTAVNVTAAVSHQVIVSVNSDGTVTQAQPAFPDISGAATTAQLPTVAKTYSKCIVVGANNAASPLANGDLGPQSRQAFIPQASTLIEMEVAADGGTPNVIMGRSHAGVITNTTSAALATAASGGIACSNTGGTVGLDTVTTCSATLQNTAFAAGDWITLVSGTAGGVANEMTICGTFTIN